ncbi:hypothetical protein BBO_05393 [Beauveria brongniartii RCEF 3172]|uniref:Uncharacterized protein n=1 Tax=Beauveria brongniartii RCEF 3172 TaxID=1081107 RepID=A0A167D7G0_9HYPO|nr:hypothetical protein BBO_05393 [Beauveria brongniartii RCEF 3172]
MTALVAHLLKPRAKFGPVAFRHGTGAIQAQYARCLVKGAEKHRHPAVLADMADGLASGSHGVDIGYLVGAEHGEGLLGQPFGRTVDVTAS